VERDDQNEYGGFELLFINHAVRWAKSTFLQCGKNTGGGGEKVCNAQGDQKRKKTWKIKRTVTKKREGGEEREGWDLGRRRKKRKAGTRKKSKKSNGKKKVLERKTTRSGVK